MSSPQIAALVGTDESHVRKVIHAFNERGFASLDPEQRGGRPHRITDKQRARSGAGVIDIENVASGDQVSENTIRRHGVAGPGIRVLPHSRGMPEQVSIANNTIILDGDANAIHAESVRDTGIGDNDIAFTGAAPNGSGIFLRAPVRSMGGLTTAGNSFSGPAWGPAANVYAAAVRLAASPFPIDGVTVAVNSSRGAVHSLRCDGPQAGFPLPIVSPAHRWNHPPASPAPPAP